MRELNKKEDMQKTKLEDQEQIVHQYLEALLSEIPEYGVTETATEIKQETAEVITITPSTEVVSEEIQQQVVAERVEYFEEEFETREERPAPDWAQESFQCLIMRVGELTLAIPLLALDNIVKWDTEPTPMPFQPTWHMGTDSRVR